MQERRVLISAICPLLWQLPQGSLKNGLLRIGGPSSFRWAAVWGLLLEERERISHCNREARSSRVPRTTCACPTVRLEPDRAFSPLWPPRKFIRMSCRNHLPPVHQAASALCLNPEICGETPYTEYGIPNDVRRTINTGRPTPTPQQQAALPLRQSSLTRPQAHLDRLGKASRAFQLLLKNVLKAKAKQRDRQQDQKTRSVCFKPHS